MPEAPDPPEIRPAGPPHGPLDRLGDGAFGIVHQSDDRLGPDLPLDSLSRHFLELLRRERIVAHGPFVGFVCLVLIHRLAERLVRVTKRDFLVVNDLPLANRRNDPSFLILRRLLADEVNGPDKSRPRGLAKGGPVNLVRTRHELIVGFAPADTGRRHQHPRTYYEALIAHLVSYLSRLTLCSRSPPSNQLSVGARATSSAIARANRTDNRPADLRRCLGE